MSIRDKVKSFFVPSEKDTETLYQNNKKIANKKPQSVTPKVFFVMNYFEVEDIAVPLFYNQSVIVNISSLAMKDKYRVIDFLSGVIYVLEGTRQKLENNVYLFSPPKTND